MDTDFIDPRAEYAGFLLGMAATATRKATALALAPLSLNPREFGTLLLVTSGALTSQTQLGRLIGLDRTTTMSLIDRLEAAGWLRRDILPSHGKRNALVITVCGRSLLAKAKKAARVAERGLFESRGVTSAETAQLRDLLHKFWAGLPE